MTEPRQLPQLIMRREIASALPEANLPPGFELRHFEPGDEAHWEALVDKAFGWKRSFRKELSSSEYFKPERVLFVCREGIPVATATAWFEDQWGEDSGYLHMVGVDPEYGGLGLGLEVSLAALKRMQADGKSEAVLETDDFRIPAIKTYLKLQFWPDIRLEKLEDRWRLIYRKLNLPFGVKVEAATRPGNPLKLNEDALVVNHRTGIYGVIDGVSSMAPYRDEAGRTGGHIAANLLAEALNGDDPAIDLREAVLRANAVLNERMLAAGIELTDTWKRWGAVFAIARWCGSHVEFVQTGDCMLFARYKDGSVRALTRNQVAEFDLLTLTAKRQLKASGSLTEEEIGARMKPLFKSNRNQANAPDGYSVMNGDAALERYMESGRISTANLVRLYAVSDGMFHFIENEEDPGKWKRFADRLDERGIESYMDELAGEEELDSLCERYPRHKKSDDKSAVIVERLR